MRKFVLLYFVVMTLCSCKEQSLTIFDNHHEIYFEKFFVNEVSPGTATKDSTMVTFFFAKEDETFVYADLVVCLSGRKLENDLSFSLRVVEEGTTALPDEYVLEDSYVFRASTFNPESDMIRDTIHVQMNKSTRLEGRPEGVRLEVALVPNKEVGVGQYERSRAVIVLTKDPVRPYWWTREVDGYLLGTYSPEKYKLFLENIPGAYDLNEKMILEEPDRALKLAREFKSWLNANGPFYTGEDELIDVPV